MSAPGWEEVVGLGCHFVFSRTHILSRKRSKMRVEAQGWRFPVVIKSCVLVCLSGWLVGWLGDWLFLA